MTPARWQTIKAILEQAPTLAEADIRPWLERMCDGDPSLMAEVETFLVHVERLDGFLEKPVLDLTGHGTASRGPDSGTPSSDRFGSRSGRLIGQRVGPYRIERLIAEGGMGAVYIAEREEEFEQRVALKLVRRGVATPEMLRRFHDERQILARLEHPNIARLLDGGTTTDGVPYFAMELIEGEPIDQYCDRHAFDERQRIELFMPVCAALALAHQSLVVHHDLKPGNILVDSAGTPKLLDFGIATLLGGTKDAAPAAYAAPGIRAMTPRYASPEQALGETVGTTSDVYSLAVVIRLVLTGQRQRGFQSPLLPDLTSETPNVEQPQLRPVAADVEAILARALRLDPQERYASIEQLAADFGRFLTGRPVLARRGGVAYRLGKLIGRHRLGFVSLVTILTLGVGFTVALVRQLRLTEISRDHATAISTFMVDIFQSAAPDRLAGDEPTLRDLLDLGRAKLASDLGQQPEVRATLLFKLGEVYIKLGDYAEARSLLVESIDLLRRSHDGPHPDVATVLNDLASVHFKTGDLVSAEARFRESLAMRRALGRSEDLIKPMNNLATILLERGAYAEAQTIYRESLAMRRAAMQASPADTFAKRNLATNLRSLATALHRAGDLDSAEPLLQESLELRQEIYGSDSPRVATVLLSLGRLEHARGRLERASELVGQGLEIREKSLGDHHPHTALACRDLGAVRLALGDTDGARSILVRARQILKEPESPDATAIAEVEGLLGAVMAVAGEIEDAEAYLRRALMVLEAKLGPSSDKARAARDRLADLLASTGRRDEAAIVRGSEERP